MPSKRSPGQILVGFWADKQMRDAIDAARAGRSRSDFLRESIADFLKATGHPLPKSAVVAPDRAGKGGPSKSVNSQSKIVRDIVRRRASKRGFAEGGGALHDVPPGSKT